MKEQSTRQLTRRELFRVAGAAFAGAALATVSRPSEALAQVGDPVRNTEINIAQPGVIFHPETNGERWSYGHKLQGLDGVNMSSEKVGQLTLSGIGDLGVNVITDPQHIGDYQRDGARAAAWVHAGKGDILYLMDGDNQPVRLVQVDDNGFGGILYPDDNSKVFQYGIRIVRASGSSKEVVVDFSNISQEDFVDPNKRNNSHVIDAENIEDNTPVPIANSQLPEFLPAEAVFTFQEAPVNTYFLAKSGNGIGWSHFLEFNIPERRNGVFVRDNGNVGEFFMQNRGLPVDSAKNMDIVIRTNPLFANDSKEGDSQNRPGMWIKTQPGARIQAVDVNTDKVVASVAADGAGFGGVVMPDSFSVTFKLRVVLPFIQTDFDTQIQFGAEKPNDRGKSSTLDLNNVIPKP